MKTRKILALCCGLLFFLNGCSVIPHVKQPAKKEPVSYADPLKYHSQYKDHLQYQGLSEDGQRCYGMLYTTIQDAVDTNAFITDEQGTQQPGVCVPFDVGLTKEDMSLLYESFLKDNPQFFFLDRTYRLEGHQEGGEAVYDALLLQFTLSKSDRQTAIQHLNNAVDDILNDCPDTQDEYVIEKYFHDYLIASCTYDEEAANADAETHENAYSAYGALVDGRAVCEGYAKAMQLLLQKKAIPATVVMGYAADDGESHMWNLVRINGSYYYLDVTWDDNDTIPQYTFFNMTSDTMQRTHKPDVNPLLDIRCTAVTDNYFVRNGTYCATNDREDIAYAIAQRVRADDVFIHLLFAPEAYESALLFLKNMSVTQRKVNAQLDNQKMWDYTLSTQTKQYTITLIRTN